MGIGYVMKEAVKNELENKELYEVKLPIELPIPKPLFTAFILNSVISYCIFASISMLFCFSIFFNFFIVELYSKFKIYFWFSSSFNSLILIGLLGTTLFYREKDGVKLTGAGQEFFKYAEQGLATLNLGEKLIMQKNDLETGEIAIGCPSHLTTFYLMDCIEKSKSDYPNKPSNCLIFLLIAVVEICNLLLAST